MKSIARTRGKSCPDCGQTDRANFARNKNAKSGYQTYCRPCQHRRGRASYEKMMASRVVIPRPGRPPIPASDRFWYIVDRRGPNECWPWTGTLDKDGYGKFSINQRTSVRAHRFAYEDRNGPVPQGRCVLHRCDYRPCCNPTHLFIGTRQDNNADKMSKGRQYRKVTTEMRHAVLRLRAEGLTFKQIQARVPLNLKTISKIVRG